MSTRTAPADHIDPWAALPDEECRSIWDETERRFWPKYRSERREELMSGEDKYRHQTMDLSGELATLTERHKHLRNTQERLARELAETEQQLALVRDAKEETSNRLADLDKQHNANRQDLFKRQHKMAVDMTNFFRSQRGEKPLPPNEIDIGYDTNVGPPPTKTATPLPAPARMEDVRYSHAQPDPRFQPRQANQAPSPMGRVTDFIDADGRHIGVLRQMEPWNHWVQAIQKLPILRQVKIRRGRSFTEANMDSVYNSSEAKGVKWISCMIQATGRTQTRRCQSCEKNQGAFENCVIVGGSLFPKCGNCEWNRQGCHGASGEMIDNVPVGDGIAPEGPPTVELAERYTRAAEEAARPRPEERWPDQADHAKRLAQQHTREAQANSGLYGHEREPIELPRRDLRPSIPPLNGTFHRPEEIRLPPLDSIRVGPPRDHLPPREQFHPPPYNHTQSIARAADMAREALAPEPRMPYPQTYARVEDLPRLPNGSRQLMPIPPMQKSPHHPMTIVNSGFTPANVRSRPVSREMQGHLMTSVEPSPQPMDVEIDENLPEINRANLVLENNGEIYTWPPFMHGVPIEKVDEKHWYWDPQWKNVRSIIEPQLQSWKDKHQAAVEAEAQGKKAGSSKYQVGRQVNRGKKILEFLDDGPISPYQLLGKKYIQIGKGGITSYDTLFRLSESLSELEKFNLDVPPVDWLRHRLYELMAEQKQSFNLGKTIHDFYHDPKLTSLRYKHGFKNIGRPSGSRWSGHKGHPNPTPPFGGHPLRKRKSTHSHEGTPRGSPSAERSPLSVHVATSNDGRTVESTPLPSPTTGLHPSKRSKPESVSPGRQDVFDEFHYDDVSDTDSWSGAALSENDWRLYQVKTRLWTSSDQVTQYWTWDEKRRVLEHQALKETDPAQWGRHRQPVDFDVKLDDIVQVRWNIPAMRVILVMRREGAEPSKKDGLPRGDIMASFKRPNTAKRFLNFCRKQRLTMFQEVQDDMMKRWDDLKSEQLPDKDEDASEELKK